MTVEDQLRQAMADQAAAIAEPVDRWHDIEARSAATRRSEALRRRRRAGGRRAGGLAVLGVAVGTAAALIALPALTREPVRRVVVTPGNRPTTVVTPVPAAPTAVGPSATSTTRLSPAPPLSPTTPTTFPAAGFNYQPLYPFRNLQEASAWQDAYRATGIQPWHIDPGQTALSFAGFLGYTDVTTAFGVWNDATGAHVTVGFSNPNGNPVNSAVVHLRRFGAAKDAPWEVVGTDDTPNFSLTSPRYGATVSSPLLAGGAIMGVDESIRVQVLQVSSAAPLGVSCCQPAGNSGAPWATTVAFRGASDKVLVVAASTGGHLAAVERFTITGVRTSAGTTPGL
ncbi:MAG: hypothetical protein M3083_14065 [Actinomycetota bacterium]|nr:hypothetical protein [Actinomycetota bacterium]